MENCTCALVPCVDPIVDPFTSEDCLEILMCQREVFVDLVDECFAAGAISFVSFFYPRFRFFSYWDIVCMALTIHFNRLGIGRRGAIRVASLVVDELASEYDLAPDAIAVNISMIDHVYSQSINEWVDFPEDQYAQTVLLLEIQLLLSALSERCSRIMDRSVELPFSCRMNDKHEHMGAMTKAHCFTSDPQVPKRRLRRRNQGERSPPTLS